MKERVETILNIVLVVAAILVAAAAVDRQFLSGNGPAAGEAAPPTYVDDWEQLLEGGVLVGDGEASVKIIEFTDLECSFCRRFHSAVADTKAEYGSDVALVFVHYPLGSHDLALPAAVAAECAAQEDRFGAFIDAVYAKQDSLGVKPWSSYAAEAGIRDTTAFSRCVADNETFPRIERGRALASEWAVRGTPTVLINGWRFPHPPYALLSEIVGDMIAGKDPSLTRDEQP